LPQGSLLSHPAQVARNLEDDEIGSQIDPSNIQLGGVEVAQRQAPRTYTFSVGYYFNQVPPGTLRGQLCGGSFSTGEGATTRLACMIKRTALVVTALVGVVLVLFYAVGKGWLGQPISSGPVTQGPGPRADTTGVVDTTSPPGEPTILFGDLHTHTNHSVDAYLFNTALVKGGGVVTPADACDFARYCAALDFWSINDHAEGLTPRAWSDTVSTIRECNAQAGSDSTPDMVSFLGWEWSNSSRDNVASHYGHKNVIFRTWEEGQVPLRPIAASQKNLFSGVSPLLVGVLSVFDGLFDASGFGWYLEESANTPLCAPGTPSRKLPADCLEVALTPTDLYRKLDEWGLDSMVIPHGLSWGTTNPLTGDFRTQLDEHEERYQKLLEVYSGHGSSEIFEDFTRIAKDTSGELECPEATANFTPCCRQAGEIARSHCADPESAACDEEVESAVQGFLVRGTPRGRKLFDDATLDDWAGCGQLQNNFQPSSQYVPRLSAQYNLALGFDENGQPRRARLGLIGSSDGHQARPGSSFKENNRLLYTDHKDRGQLLTLDLNKADRESGGFYYTGGLVAAHANGRDRNAIWNALESRNVYATSGDRMLVWFDLLNSPSGSVPMGSEIAMVDTPRFRVRALGAFEQLPGCSDYATAALGRERTRSLCGGECYQPDGSRRKAITGIEIVRIRPQLTPDEAVAPLVEDRWQVFECPGLGEGCTIEFDDPDYATGGRSTLYYARVIQAPELLIVGDPFGCEYDAAGQCIKRNYCVGENAQPDMNCRSEAEPRAWTSPIFVEYAGGASR
jgi:hypothetical protein